MATIKDYRIKISADLADFEKSFSTLGDKFKAVFGQATTAAKSYGEVERAERIASANTTIEQLDKVETERKRAAKEAREDSRRAAKEAAADAKGADPAFQKRLDAQKAAEADYFAKQAELRKHAVKEAETDGIFQYGNTKKRLLAEADLAASNVKRLEAIRDYQLTKAKGNLEQEFKVRTMYEQKITNATILEAKKRDAAGEVKSRKMKGSAEFGENISTIAGGGLAQANFAGIGAGIGDMLGGPIGGAIGTAIGTGLTEGIKIVGAIMDHFDGARIFADATKRADELRAKSIEIGDAVKTIGKDVSLGDVDHGIEEAKKQLEAIKVVSPDIAKDLEVILNMPGGKSISDLKTIQELMGQVQSIAKNDAMVKQFEASDNAMEATRKSLEDVVSSADSSWKLFSAQTTSTLDQKAALADVHKEMEDANLTMEEKLKLQRKEAELQNEILKKDNARSLIQSSFEAATRSQLAYAEKLKGSALTEAEMANVIVKARQDINYQIGLAKTSGVDLNIGAEALDKSMNNVLDSWKQTNSITAGHNTQISGMQKGYDETNKTLNDMLETQLASNRTDQEKEEIENAALYTKMANLKLIEADLAAQEAAIIAAIAAQENSVDAENKRIEAANILAKKQLEIKEIIAGEKKEVSALEQVKTGDLSGALTTIQKQRREVQKTLESIDKAQSENFKKRYDSKGMLIKEGGGGGGGEDLAKKRAEEEKKAAEEAAKLRLEMLKDQNKVEEEAHKAKLEEAAKIRQAAEERQKAEKELIQRVTDYAKQLNEQVKALKESHFNAIGSTVNDYIDQFDQTLIKISQITGEYSKALKESEKALADNTKKMEEQGGILDASGKELQEVEANLRKAKREKEVAETGARTVKYGSVTGESKQVTNIPEGGFSLAQLKQAESNIPLFNEMLKAAGKSYVNYGTVAANIEHLKADLLAIGKLEKNITNEKDNQKAKEIQEEDYRHQAADATADIASLEKRKSELESRITAASLADKELRLKARLDEKTIREQLRLKPLVDLEEELTYLQQITTQRKEIAEIQKEAELETDPLKRAKLLFDATKKQAELDKKIHDTKLIAFNTEGNVDLDNKKEGEELLQNNIENLKVFVTNSGLLKDASYGTLKAIQATDKAEAALVKNKKINTGLESEKAMLARVDFETRLKELDLAKERGEYNNKELNYLLNKATIQAQGVAQLEEMINGQAKLDNALATANAKFQELQAGQGKGLTADLSGTVAPLKKDTQEELRAAADELAAAQKAADEGHKKYSLQDIENAKERLKLAKQAQAIADLTSKTAAEATLKTLNETLGITTELQKIEEKRVETIAQLDDLLKSGHLSEKDYWEKRNIAYAQADKASNHLIDALNEQLNLNVEGNAIANKYQQLQVDKEKAQNKYNDLIDKINKAEKDGETTAEGASKKRRAAELIHLREVNDARVKYFQEGAANIAGWIDTATSSIKTFETMLNAGTVQEGVSAGIELTQQIGQALLNFKGDPTGTINVIGAILVGGALIAKASMQLAELFIPVQETKVQGAERESALQERILALEQARVSAMQKLVELGDKSVDTAQEQLAAQKQAHDLRLAESAQARQLGDLSNARLGQLLAENAEKKKAAEDEKAHAEYLRDHGTWQQKHDFLHNQGLEYGLAVTKGIKEFIEGTDSDLKQMDNTEKLINAEIDYRKTSMQEENAILDAQIALLQLRAKIEGDSKQNLEDIAAIRRKELTDAMARAGIDVAGKTDDEIKKILATAEMLPDAVIQLANGWLDADKAAQDYGKTVTDTANSSASAAAKENKALTDLTISYQRKLILLRQLASLQGGQMTAAQKADLSTIKASMVAELTKAGSTPEEINKFLASLPEFATGGIVPGAYDSPQLVTAHGGEWIIPTNITKKIMDSMNSPYSGGSTGVNLLATPAAKYLGESMRMKEAAIYNIANNINIVVNQKNDFAAMDAGEAIDRLGAQFESMLYRRVNKGIESGKVDLRRS